LGSFEFWGLLSTEPDFGLLSDFGFRPSDFRSWAHRPACQPAGSPGGLKIEPASKSINIKQFTAQIEARANSAFHGFETDLAQAHAPARNELFFIETLSNDLQLGVMKLLH